MTHNLSFCYHVDMTTKGFGLGLGLRLELGLRLCLGLRLWLGLRLGLGLRLKLRLRLGSAKVEVLLNTIGIIVIKNPSSGIWGPLLNL